LKSEKVTVLTPLTVSLRLTADDATLKDAFSRLSNFRDIAALLEVDPKILRYYLRQNDNYREFELTKPGGGSRRISSPVSALKIIQRKLNQVLHAVYGGRSPVHGFARKKSIVTNANKHLNKEFILNLDLQDFFPSIHFGRVRGLFAGKPYGLPDGVAVTLAQICSHNKALPAGAPTSPTVANMVCAQMDAQLKRLAINFGCTYTRYADDVTFSVKRGPFPPAICYRDPTTRQPVVGTEIVKVLVTNGFQINTTKTRLLPRGHRQEVTGLIVGARANVNRKFVRHVRGMLHAAKKFGLESAAAHFTDRKQRLGPAEFKRILRGKIEFVGAVRGRDDIIYFRLLQRFLKEVPSARSRRIIVGGNASPEVIETAIWLLDGASQGTGFAVEGLDIVTAAHVLGNDTTATSIALGIQKLAVTEIRKHDHVDVATVSVKVRLPVRLKIGSSANLKVGDQVKILGFPLHRAGGSVHTQQATITARSPWFGVEHFIVGSPIVQGNSGGPVLNQNNEVVGIAVRGQGIPGRVGNDDELSRFVPMDVALPHLR
jgi:RNA-directed DNA polymerase